MSRTIALVAGEMSGDQLGADLIAHLRKSEGDLRFFGIGGARMRAAGMETWGDCEELAVFGLFEVLRHIPRIWRLRRSLLRRLRDLKPDVFIGIDAPDFNLGVEKRLKRLGIRTVHYVSPTVWAWRQGRARKMSRCADLVLCLFPFEPEFYARHGVKAVFVGHPMADQIDPQDSAPTPTSTPNPGPNPNPGTGRKPPAGPPVIALLPGSRESEIARLAQPMLSACARLARNLHQVRFQAAMANPRVRKSFEIAVAASDAPPIELFDGQARQVIAAADVVIVASGTATLETMLINRPMVVVYRISGATHRLAKSFNLLKTAFVALPNILAGARLVPELLQDDATGANIAAGVEDWLADPVKRQDLVGRFQALHQQLRCDAGRKAGEQVLGLLDSHSNAEP